jgi:hypothetical protein
MHWFFLKLCLQDAKWNARHALVQLLYHHIGAYQLLNQPNFWPNNSSKFMNFEGSPLLYQWWQYPWFIICATCVEPTLGLFESKGVLSKTPCDMVEWVFNPIQVCTNMVFYCSISITNHLWWEVGRCRNLSFGLVTKARACKVAGQEGSPGVKESVREWTFTLPRELPPRELES